MSSDLVRYLATGGTITACGYVAHVISLKMRLRFSRYVVDRAVEQGQPIDPVEIITAATSPGPADRLKGFAGGHLRGSPGAGTPGKQSALPPPIGGPPGLCSR
jgi:hypothetical protein